MQGKDLSHSITAPSPQQEILNDLLSILNTSKVRLQCTTQSRFCALRVVLRFTVQSWAFLSWKRMLRTHCKPSPSNGYFASDLHHCICELLTTFLTLLWTWISVLFLSSFLTSLVAPFNQWWPTWGPQTWLKRPLLCLSAELRHLTHRSYLALVCQSHILPKSHLFL